MGIKTVRMGGLGGFAVLPGPAMMAPAIAGASLPPTSLFSYIPLLILVGIIFVQIILLTLMLVSVGVALVLQDRPWRRHGPMLVLQRRGTGPLCMFPLGMLPLGPGPGLLGRERVRRI